MFKQCLIVAALVGCVLAWTIPEKYQPIAKEVLEVCAKATNTDVEFIKKMREATELPAEGSDDETKLKKYMHCGVAHTGVFKDGKFNDEVAAKLIEGFEEIYNKPLQACKHERGEDDVESIWKIIKCCYANLEDKKHFFLY